MTDKNRYVVIIIIVLWLTSCSSAPEKNEKFETTVSAPASVPACLSVQEGDRHVEFNGQDLFLAEEGKPRQLEIDNGNDVLCEKLEIIRSAKQPSVFIQFRTRQAGTSIGVSDLKIAIASIKDAKWVLSPVILERSFQRAAGLEVQEQRTFHWQPMNESSSASLVIVDSATHKSTVVQP